MRCAPNFGGGEKVIISMLLLCGNGGERGGRCCELDGEGQRGNHHRVRFARKRRFGEGLGEEKVMATTG